MTDEERVEILRALLMGCSVFLDEGEFIDVRLVQRKLELD